MDKLNAIDLVVQLLDLCEGLDDKARALVKTTGFTVEQIKEIAKGDPTSDPTNAKSPCRYLEWLCRLVKAGTLDIADVGKAVPILNSYKKAQEMKLFRSDAAIAANASANDLPEGNIMHFKSLDEVANLEQVKKTGSVNYDEAKARQGTQFIGKHGPFSIIKVTNFDAAKAAASLPHRAWSEEKLAKDFSSIKGHTKDPNYPASAWCTQIKGHYTSYGVLIIVRKGKYPLAQLSLDRSYETVLNYNDDALTPAEAEDVKTALVNIMPDEIMAMAAEGSPAYTRIDKDRTLRWVKSRKDVMIHKDTHPDDADIDPMSKDEAFRRFYYDLLFAEAEANPRLKEIYGWKPGETEGEKSHLRHIYYSLRRIVLRWHAHEARIASPEFKAQIASPDYRDRIRRREIPSDFETAWQVKPEELAGKDAKRQETIMQNLLDGQNVFNINMRENVPASRNRSGFLADVARECRRKAEQEGRGTEGFSVERAQAESEQFLGMALKPSQGYAVFLDAYRNEDPQCPNDII